MGFYKLLLAFGILSLMHSAYSAAQHRTYLRITEQEFQYLPLDITIQALVSLLVVLWSLIQVVGDFKEIRAAIDLQEKSWETLSNLQSFYIFNHRGRSLSPDYQQPIPMKADSLNE